MFNDLMLMIYILIFSGEAQHVSWFKHILVAKTKMIRLGKYANGDTFIQAHIMLVIRHHCTNPPNLAAAL